MISSRPPDSAALLTALASAVDAGAGLDTSSSEACANAGQPNKGTPATMKIETEVSSPEARILIRSEEHTSELQSLMRISYAVFCLKKKQNTRQTNKNIYT